MASPEDKNETSGSIVVVRHVVLCAIVLLFFGNEGSGAIFFGYWFGRVLALVAVAGLLMGLIRLFFTKSTKGEAVKIFVFILWAVLVLTYYGWHLTIANIFSDQPVASTQNENQNLSVTSKNERLVISQDSISQGRYSWTNGSYVGEMRGGKPNGRGKKTLVDGYTYVGEVKDGEEHGLGTATYAAGEVYVGEFKNGNKDGNGTFSWPDGQKYIGEFRNGKKNGYGTETLPSGDVLHSGQWFDGAKVD